MNKDNTSKKFNKSAIIGLAMIPLIVLGARFWDDVTEARRQNLERANSAPVSETHVEPTGALEPD